MTIIRFGTDGWRGVIAEDYTFDNVRRCAQGFANYLLATQPDEARTRGVVVGGDRRFGSEHFVAATTEVLAGNHIPVHYCGGGVPTPIISFSVVERRAIGAVNITASHNPPTDNGFKVRDSHGGAIDPAGLIEIESCIPTSMADVRRLKLDDCRSDGLVKDFDPNPAYLAQLARLIDVTPIRDAGFTILAEPMWGNGAGWFPRLLSGGKSQIIEVHHERNPIFPEMIRPEPIPPNIDAGLAKAREIGADVVCITDGDADRCGFGDEHGQFVDQLRVYGLLAMYLLEVRGLRGPIVRTLSTTSMLDKLGKRYGVPVFQTGVGFKYVAPKMLETNALIGGEESGGYAFGDHIPERDGILANLYLLDLMVQTGKKPTQLLDMLFERVGGPHYYDRVDRQLESDEFRLASMARLDDTQPQHIAGLKVIDKNTTDGYKFTLEDNDWLLIRFSGTEPLIRVYTETTRADLVRPILEEGLRLAGLD